MTAHPRRIILLTDFGTADGYVAAIRGVIATIAPAAMVEDASHSIAPGDIRAAAWALNQYWKLHPPGTIHLVVVDPGVGGPRRPLASEALGRFLIGPDNGVLSHALDAVPNARVCAVENPRHMRLPVSRTFHGRDVFAPAAAHIASGGDIADLGPPVHDPVRLGLEPPLRSEHSVRGEVIHVDRFGNLITNIPVGWVDGAAEIVIEGKPVGPVRSSYSEVDPGERLAIIGSADLLEIAVRDGSAAATLDVRRGAEVVVRFV